MSQTATNVHPVPVRAEAPRKGDVLFRERDGEAYVVVKAPRKLRRGHRVRCYVGRPGNARYGIAVEHDVDVRPDATGDGWWLPEGWSWADTPEYAATRAARHGEG